MSRERESFRPEDGYRQVPVQIEGVCMRVLLRPLDRPSLLGAIVMMVHLVAESCRSALGYAPKA